MANGIFTPYSTVAGFFAAFPAWVPQEDRERIASYQIYEEIYWNHPETFKITLRGSNGKPLYVPSGRTIVDAICRYTAKKFSIQVVGGNEAVALQAFNDLFARERFRSKFNSFKKQGTIRGDALFHITADGNKPQGTRLSINVADPASYFPIYDDATGNHIVKVHLAEQFLDAEGNPRVRRQTYEKTEQGIMSSLGVFEVDGWAGGEAKAVVQEIPPTLLPPQITAIPVYHWRNKVEEGNPFGSSEMRGLETLMAGINQSMSDEDITLALMGLGMYKTGNGAPVDDDGNETDWLLGPGRVVEDDSFEKVTGVTTVAPFGDHIDRLDRFLKETSGTSQASVGRVDVAVAESGVALALEMAPTLNNAEEKETELKDVLSQMFFDLKTWLQVYESINLADTAVIPVFGDPLPVNLKQEIENVSVMVAEKIMSATTARERLGALGIRFAEDEATRILQEAAAAAATAAPVGEGEDTDIAGRVRAELEGSEGAETGAA